VSDNTRARVGERRPSETPVSENPYVGPRPLRGGEPLYGRDRDARELIDLLLASRTVLLHAPSGAGKTSIIQSRLIPSMSHRGFHICAKREIQQPPTEMPRFSALRVSTPPPPFAVRNRYVFSAVMGLLGSGTKHRALAQTSLSEALDMFVAESGEDASLQLLLFDQLEEILTLDPTDLDGQRWFFDDLGEALEDERRWALLSIREDFMGGLDRFLCQIPGGLRAQYRLDFLDPASAFSAIVGPARERQVTFTPDAAKTLVDKMRMVNVQGPDGVLKNLKGPFVEPVLLQVVCHRLWQQLIEPGTGVKTITVNHVADHGRIGQALRTYYSEVVAAAAKSSGGQATDKSTTFDKAREAQIRKWLDLELITRAGYRSQTSSPPSMRDSASVLKVLQDQYLIRGDPRGTIWYELTHDRLVRPIREDNAAWRKSNLKKWEADAWAWALRQDDVYLLRGDDLRQAKTAWTKENSGVTEQEAAFLKESERDNATEKLRQRIWNWVSVLGVGLVASVVLNVLLILYLFFRA
jgi:hypothetical protein